MLDKKKKQRIIAKFKTHANDTGSSEIQIAILSEEIKELTEHLKLHAKDFSSRRGLIKKVSERRKLLRYLERENNASFLDIIKKLKLKAPRHENRPSATAILEEEEKQEELKAQEEATPEKVVEAE